MSDDVTMQPMDEHNRDLVTRCHPPDWASPAPAEKYNLVVIGAGTAGLVTAAGAAGLGAKVALIERHLLGGDCLNVGCVPSKCLIRSARVAADARRAGDYGVRINGEITVDFPAVMERMRRLRSRISEHDSAERFKGLGVDVFFGQGRFLDSETIEVEGRKLTFYRAVIATGARAVTPDIPGIEETGFLTNETIFNLTELPKRLAVFGAGPLGCELAQAFRRFGSEVTIFEMKEHLLMREDPDAAEIVQRAFVEDGINLMLNTKVCEVRKANGEKVVCADRDGKRIEVRCDEILIGAGRRPNVENLGLDKVEVEYDDRKGIKVDDSLQTTNHHIYAAGDICLKYKFTHTADASARIVIRNALLPGHSRLSALTVPWCTYVDPEIAHVGMYERDAQEDGIEVETFTEKLAGVDRAVADGRDEGLVKIHVEKGHDRILGGTIVAEHAGETISEITLAMVAGAGLSKLSETIHPYPTQAEGIRHAADAYNRTRLKPFVKTILDHIMAWER